MRTNILISDKGYIVKIYRSSYSNQYYLSKVDAVYNAKDRLILPGLIDIHVHMREPGYEYKEDFDSGTKAALASGITIVGDMPNNNPKIDNVFAFEKKLKLAQEKSWVDFFLYVYLDSNQEFEKVAKTVGYVKIYLYDKNVFSLISSAQKKFPSEPIYVFHAEHPHFIKKIEPKDAVKHHLAHSPRAEIEGTKIAVRFAEKGYRVHVTHMSVPLAIKEILDARKRGLKITFDITPHHTIFYLEKIDIQNPIFKVNPPIRPKLLRDDLLKLLYQNKVDVIVTDHAPHSPAEKNDFISAPSGISSIQYLLPLLYSLARKINLKFSDVLSLVTENPARIFNLKNRGTIKVGYLADLVIFNPRRRWIIDPEYSLSKAKYTPYDNMLVRGYVDAVFLRGELVYENGHFLKKLGKYITT